MRKWTAVFSDYTNLSFGAVYDDETRPKLLSNGCGIYTFVDEVELLIIKAELAAVKKERDELKQKVDQFRISMSTGAQNQKDNEIKFNREIVELKAENTQLRTWLGQYEDGEYADYKMDLLKENSKLREQNEAFRAELEYFVARCEGRHEDGFIKSFRTLGRYRALLAKYPNGQ